MSPYKRMVNVLCVTCNPLLQKEHDRNSEGIQKQDEDIRHMDRFCTRKK